MSGDIRNNNDNSDDGSIGNISAQAKEAHKGIQRIIEIWSSLAKHEDPCICVLTLIATIIGFLALTTVIIVCIYAMARDLPDSRFVLGILGLFLVLFLAVAAPIALRLSRIMSVRRLESGFGRVYNQKSGQQ
ncbi:hypothetical protein ACFL6S_25580 [Candidatus Poribacteria bacterium]